MATRTINEILPTNYGGAISLGVISGITQATDIIIRMNRSGTNSYKNYDATTDSSGNVVWAITSPDDFWDIGMYELTIIKKSGFTPQQITVDSTTVDSLLLEIASPFNCSQDAAAVTASLKEICA